MRRTALALLVVTAAACQAPTPTAPPPEVRFVHATTRDLATAPPSGSTQTAEDTALANLLRWLRVAAPGGPQAEFLVLTGDFGLAGFAKAAGAPTPPAKPEDADGLLVDRITAALKSGPPGLVIYVVPGAAVLLPTEGARQALVRAQRVLAAAAQKLAPDAISLRDLSLCYTSDATCAARVPGTSLRLVGYPSYLARNVNADGTLQSANTAAAKADSDAATAAASAAAKATADAAAKAGNTDAAKGADTAPKAAADTAAKAAGEAAKIEHEWLSKLEVALQNPDPQLTTVLVTPLAAPLPARWSSDQLTQRFDRLVSFLVVGGVAIHGNATSRFVYEPRGRTTADTERSGQTTLVSAVSSRMLVAPPLLIPGTKGGGQPQGVSLVTVSPAGLSRRMFWYDPDAAPFTSDFGANQAPTAGWLGAFFAPWWNLDTQLNPLSKNLLVGIAVLAAFLTVVAVWQIPPPKTDLAPPATPDPPPSTGDQLRGTFLSTRLAITVASGFGGLAVVKMASSIPLWKGLEPNADAFYLVWFIITFFVLMVTSALFRAGLESIRSSIFLVPQPYRTVQPLLDSGAERRLFSRPGKWRIYALTLGDVFFNVIQGRNELKSALWGETIVKLQENIVLAADRIRESIRAAVLETIGSRSPEGVPRGSDSVRVAISVLSDDRKEVYYISWSADSLGKSFDVRSVAWIAIAGGKARWWKRDQLLDEGADKPLYGDSIVIFNNKRDPPRLTEIDPIEHTFDLFLQDRDQDYAAFVVLPVPFRRRGDGDGRYGGIHISLKHEADLDKLFVEDFDLDDTPPKEGAHAEAKTLAGDNPGPPSESPSGVPDTPKPVASETKKPAAPRPRRDPFKVAADLLDNAQQPLGSVLDQGAKVLGVLLRDFNEKVFLHQIRPKRRL